MSVPAALRLIVRRGPDERRARREEQGLKHGIVETERTARRVLGGAHPVTTGIEGALRDARAALRARETPSGSA